jgi:hypothetical protein
VVTTGQDGAFKGRHFTAEVILWARRGHLAFPISYRDLSAMLADRGIAVDHTTPSHDHGGQEPSLSACGGRGEASG